MSEPDDPYLYPGTDVLQNRFDIRDNATLAYIERELVQQRISEGAPAGAFDLKHLQAIHRHLFQDLYDWAGQLRAVELAKGQTQFMPFQRIEMGVADIHRRLVRGEFHRGLDQDDFAAAAAMTIGDLNHAHPFREGNGRTQLEYLRQLALQAGHELELDQLRPEPWIAASRAAHLGDYDLMRDEIGRAFSRRRGHDQDLRR